MELEFHPYLDSKNKFEKSVHLIGFTIRNLSNLSPLQGMLAMQNTVFQIFCMKNSLTV